MFVTAIGNDEMQTMRCKKALVSNLLKCAVRSIPRLGRRLERKERRHKIGGVIWKMVATSCISKSNGCRNYQGRLKMLRHNL
jgi:hypothetical protein